MKHPNDLSLRGVDASALDYARQLQAALSGLRLEDEGADGDGSGSGSGDGGQGDDTGDGETVEGDDGDGGNDSRRGIPSDDEIPELSRRHLVKLARDLRQETDQLRREAAEANGKARTTARESAAEEARQQLAQEIGKALGLVQDEDETPDPSKLQETIAERDARLTTKTVELDAYRSAAKFTDPNLAPQGVNPDALLDSAAFLAKAEQLDPSSETYKADLESAIKTAVENNPLLAASPGGGPGPTQGPQGTPNGTPDMNELLRAAVRG